MLLEYYTKVKLNSSENDNETSHIIDYSFLEEKIKSIVRGWW